ncbi:MAG: hypothetical protein MUE40_17320 [Anaerolineae bacterium]|nr:hypothetical protein [Anaerolineae bacterium]
MGLNLRLPGRFPQGYVRRYVIPTMLMDVGVVLVAYSLAYLVRFSLVDFAITVAEALFVLFAMVVTLVMNYLAGAYHRIWRQTSGLSAGVLLRAGLFIGLITFGVNFISGTFPLSVIILAGQYSGHWRYGGGALSRPADRRDAVALAGGVVARTAGRCDAGTGAHRGGGVIRPGFGRRTAPPGTRFSYDRGRLCG